VDNYLKLQLGDPRSSGPKHCSFVRELLPLKEINKGSSEFFVADNSKGHYHRSVCGVIDWSVEDPDGKPIMDETKQYGYRLIVVFFVPYV